MARKKIREYDSKSLINKHAKRLANLDLNIKTAQINASTNFEALAAANPWLLQTKLVVKPDMLFGKRGKSGLVKLNMTYDEVVAFCREKLGSKVVINNVCGEITTFVVEPFTPHGAEYYVGLGSERDGIKVSFGACGGIDIEENWDQVAHMLIPTEEVDNINPEHFNKLLGTHAAHADGPAIKAFLDAALKVFEQLDFTLMEINPLAVVNGVALPLDMRGELDDTALFQNTKNWHGAELFPEPFGAKMSAEERTIRDMDERTGASLKLTVLNPNGNIWAMVAGGGASVIYADTVGDLGYASQLGNYAEYSGAPTREETFAYAKELLKVATRPREGGDAGRRALLIGGGVANFTDVAATFAGIVDALRLYQDAIRACNMRIYVRRGGPNYRKGLELMTEIGKELGVPMTVNGPETSMTRICADAIDYVEHGAA